MTSASEGDTIAAMVSKRMLLHRLFAPFILVLVALLLAACSIPDWIYDPDEVGLELTAEAYPVYMEIAVTGTPIDAVSYASPTPPFPYQTPDSEPSPIVVTLPPARETADQLCTDPATGNAVSYEQALALAADSPCTVEGDLQPTYFCNESTGTWWIGLSAQREGCNPACVVGANGQPAEINWRCSGINDPDQPVENFEKFSDWRGTIHRQPQGSQVEFRFLHDDGRWFDIDARENEIRQQLAVAAWSASNVLIAGEMTARPDALLVEEITLFLTKTTDPRNLSPFAMATASSQLSADEGGIYQSWAVIDGLEGQPWCEGGEGPGLGEWVQVDFSAPVEITSLHLSNGYQGDAYLYDINGRAKTVALYFDGELIDNWDLLDSAVRQSFNLAGDVVPGIVAGSVRLVIEDTYQGWEFEDTCIGELEVWGRPAE